MLSNYKYSNNFKSYLLWIFNIVNYFKSFFDQGKFDVKLMVREMEEIEGTVGVVEKFVRRKRVDRLSPYFIE